MEFYVIDPKMIGYQEWLQKVEGFLEPYSKVDVREGAVHSTGTDIAEIWHEESILFVAEGEAGGMIEVRDGDRGFYLYVDAFVGRNLSGFREDSKLNIYHPRALYGFEFSSHERSRFHLGPCKELSFIYNDEEGALPVDHELDELFPRFRRAAQCLHSRLNKVQSDKQINSERTLIYLYIDLDLTHPALLHPLFELIDRDAISRRDRQGITARVQIPSLLDGLDGLLGALPLTPESYERAQIRVEWEAKQPDGEPPVSITFLGLERRFLKPFIQIPTYRSSREFLDDARRTFKGHRVDKQQYYL